MYRYVNTLLTCKRKSECLIPAMMITRQSSRITHFYSLLTKNWDGLTKHGPNHL